MRIAVLIYGQSRFFEETAESFNKEFRTYFDHDVDVFMHTWSNVGYAPNDDRRETNKQLETNILQEKIEELYQPKLLKIEDPRERHYTTVKSYTNLLQEYVDFMGTKPKTKTPEDSDCQSASYATLAGEKDYSHYTSINKGKGELAMRYHTGQFYSISKVTQLKKEYEKKHDFEYDLVVRVRTDSFYPFIDMYGSDIKYAKAKERYYTFLHKEYDGEGILCSGLKLNYGFHNRQQLLKPHYCGDGCCNVRSISFKDGQLEYVKTSYEEQDSSDYCVVSENGIFSYPYKLWINDRQMCADSKTADRAWGNIFTTMMSSLFNDMIRFSLNKNLAMRGCGEIINGLSVQANNCKAHTIHKESNNQTGSRIYKVLHKNADKRKKCRQSASIEDLAGTRAVLIGSNEEMKSNILKGRNLRR